MALLTRLRASFLYGRALMRFHQKKYNDAVRLFEKVYMLDSQCDRKELELAYLGRCLLALGRYNEALDYLSRAYEPFRNRSKALKSDFEQREFLDTLNAFSEVLRKMGQVDRAQKIDHEAEEYMTTRKGAG